MLISRFCVGRHLLAPLALSTLGIIPGSTLIAYPRTGHALHWEQPERFARDLTTFITR